MLRRATKRLRFRFTFTKGDVALLLRALSSTHDREMRHDTRSQLARMHRRIGGAKGRELA